MKHFQHKKTLGQHFLKNDAIAGQIVQEMASFGTCEQILEIGPGHGILTKHLLQLGGKSIFVSEIDHRIIDFLKSDLGIDPGKIIEGDFLKADLEKYIKGNFCVIGNFPYNISSQILFTVLGHKNKIPLLVGMFQKEMAKRVTAKHGNKDYGVITVLVQSYYSTEYLFELSPQEFDPPPQVYSALIRLTRKQKDPGCDEAVLRKVVKTAFNQRRKKLGNALSSLSPVVREILDENKFADKRAEELSVEEFAFLSAALQSRS